MIENVLSGIALNEINASGANDNDVAFDYYKNAIKTEANNSTTVINFGYLLFKRGEYDNAEKVYESYLNSLGDTQKEDW